MSRTKTDAQVIEASLTEPALFALIFDRHFPRLARYLRRRLPAGIADDLAAETFTRAFAARERYDLSRNDAAPWLFGIASNLIREQLRLERKELLAWGRAPRVEGTSDETATVDARVDADAYAKPLADALVQLPPTERDALLLFAWEGLTYSEIAQALSLPLGSVRSALHRARRRVRGALRGLEMEVLDLAASSDQGGG